MDEFGNDIVTITQMPQSEWIAITLLLLHFGLNLLVVFILTRFMYYPKSRRRDYFFTFILISTSIFFLIYFLGSIKVKIGFALGIFAIFGILRYRTESIPIREMTYLFAITAISVINALVGGNNILELITVNVLFLLITWIFERKKSIGNLSCKLVLYDKINLIVPQKRKELLEDLEKRTGLKIEKLEVGHIDFLKDSAMIKIYYHNDTLEENSVNMITKLPKEETEL